MRQNLNPNRSLCSYLAAMRFNRCSSKRMCSTSKLKQRMRG